jgi:hypothetical protein
MKTDIRTSVSSISNKIKRKLLCLFIFLFIHESHESLSGPGSIVDEEKLRAIQFIINNTSQPYCFPSHSGSKNAYIKDNWKSFTGDVKALIYPFCLKTKELGNKLGNFFNEVACAEASGTHFISIHKQFDVTGSVNDDARVRVSLKDRTCSKVIILLIKRVSSIYFHS